jgi:MFS transporter, SP family, solute carrier family 2 (myo-inositol transporter), member 13
MADRADEPLMRNENGEGDLEEEEAYDHNAREDLKQLEDSLQHPGLFVWLLTFSAGISGLLFGCKLSTTAIIWHLTCHITNPLDATR